MTGGSCIVFLTSYGTAQVSSYTPQYTSGRFLVWPDGRDLHEPHVSCHASVDKCLHSLRAAVSLNYSPTFCCRPGMIEIKQDAAVPGGYMQTVDRLTVGGPSQ